MEGAYLMATPEPDNTHRCTAKAKSTQDRCKNQAIMGGTVCRIHGGAAPQVRAVAARRVLESFVTPALIRLEALLTDPTVPDSVAMRAVDSTLDRGGYAAPKQVDIRLTDAMVEREIALRIEEAGDE